MDRRRSLGYSPGFCVNRADDRSISRLSNQPVSELFYSLMCSPRIILVDVHSIPCADYLYDLLAARPPEASISHHAMPSFAAHCDFVASCPYLAWYLISSPHRVGMIYLSRRREIGIQIEAAHQMKGYARQAIAELRRLHPGPMLANVAPGNLASHRLFGSIGTVIQHTYRLNDGQTTRG